MHKEKHTQKGESLLLALESRREKCYNKMHHNECSSDSQSVLCNVAGFLTDEIHFVEVEERKMSLLTTTR